jgi:hypothetical protein
MRCRLQFIAERVPPTASLPPNEFLVQGIAAMTNAAIPQEVWDHEVTAIASQPIAWLWHGFVAQGSLTLLTSQWKAGKTTLLALLLSRRKQGGQLAGLAVAPGKSVVVSEEPLELWADRARRLDFGGQVCFICRPFRTIPKPEQWQALLDRIVALQQQHGIDLVVFDPLAPFLRSENQAPSVLETLLPLRALTATGLAALLLHHPGKGEKPLGQAARGSGALLGHVDVSIEMRHPGGDPLTRQRRFLALSRHAETPRRLLLELDADGHDYVVVPDSVEDDFQASWQQLRLVLDDAPQKLTRHDILAEWPPDFAKPRPAQLWRWLDGAVQRGLIACEGAGRKSDPFRYWLPEREAVWKEDPFYEIFEAQRRELKLPFQSLQQRKKSLGDDAEPRFANDGEE